MSGAAPLLRIRRPQDGAPVGEIEVSSPEEVFAAVDRVREVQPGWASLSPVDRARRMRGLRQEIHARREEIADRIIAETGKPEGEALTEILVVQGSIRFFEDRAPAILGRRRVSTRWMPWKRAWTVRDPYGVVGVISPWNYPFLLTMDPVVTALFGGNGAVLKPSELTPFTGALVPELVVGGGLPEGLVRAVQGGGETGRTLVEAGVDKIHFTGGARAGRDVLAAAAHRLLPVTLELGGKDAALVLEDADLERAARGVVFGAFFNAGQTCVATERVYVVDSIYEPFLRRVKRLASDLRAGSGGWVDVGPMVDPRRLEIVEDQLEEAVTAGARIVCGGQRADPASNVFLPTVLADVTGEMRVMRDETFGPVLPLMRVRNVDEAVAAANAHPMNLFASVWTGDASLGVEVGGRLRCGGVSVNDTLSHWALPGLPVGGVGESGFGRSRGEEGLRDLTRARSVLVHRSFVKRDPWWFPYGPRSARLIRSLLGWEGESGVRRLTGALKGLLGGER